MSILHASIISPNSIFVKGEDYFLNPVPPDEQTAEVGVATGCMKGRHGRVWMSPWSLPSARICRSFRGPRALLVPITMPLESTQACFGFWKPCCASVSSPKEHATVTTAQVAVVSHTLAAREGSAEERRPLWTLLCLGVPRLALLIAFRMYKCASEVFRHLEPGTYLMCNLFLRCRHFY